MFKSYREEGHHVSTFLASSWGFFWLYCTDLICLWTSLCDGGGGEQILVMKSVKINFQTWGWSQCHRITWGKMTRRRGFSREIQSTVTRRQREMNAGRSAAGVFNQLFSVFLAGLNVIINVKHVTPCLAQRRCPVSMSLVFQLLFHNCVCVCVCSCLENSMDRGALWATVHRVKKSHTTESTECTWTHTCIHTHTQTHRYCWLV